MLFAVPASPCSLLAGRVVEGVGAARSLVPEDHLTFEDD